MLRRSGSGLPPGWGVLRGDPAITVGVDAIGETLSVVLSVVILRA